MAKPEKSRKNAPAKAAPAKPAPGKGAGKGAAATIEIEAVGPATPDVLDRLFEVVESRRGTDPSVSHSARLLARGRRKIAQKFGEEAVECLIEAVAGNREELISESADVLYHLIVMWVDAGVKPAEVWAELLRREGTSGVAEKASRPRDPLA
ncbi:phosphoribosyl-ATP diphosphatase [Komagataeibacter sucrofermentans]|uniref:Phosphoribosyl-ATP pyrophosphatase n=1 Tax=Komagataeibacter sucrofermentans TaxID=1053551 RepID=A0A318QVP3_9PROT|nr:phosphoribosyl-ATP diphosphatase [Komagataeibacter sucrofermentans]PYD79219.1 phosphoribosyl-ATP diphosphatase [Komagataeibacter sucrofermentans]GBQ43851.1 phosphoribosyl ATP pyrophosphatase [Komagataeibacter sucrofermentans DSM 15973]